MVKDAYSWPRREKPDGVHRAVRKILWTDSERCRCGPEKRKGGRTHAQLVELGNSQNRSKDAGTFIPATFMRVTVWL